MVRFMTLALSKWSALMSPELTSARTLSDREYERKRRLLSYLLLFSLVLALLSTGLASAIVSPWQSASGWLFCIMQLVVLWFNRRGHLTIASLLFFLSVEASFLLGTNLDNHSTPLVLLWMLPPLALIIILSGLFFTAPMVIIMALAQYVLFTWYILVDRYAQLVAVLTSEQTWSFYLNLIVMVAISALIGVLYTTTTKQAIRQADRADELEQAQQNLSQAYQELKSAHALIQKQALTDGLTSVYNHRAIVEQLEKELERARRYGDTFSIIFLDADRFKQVNDQHGHSAGDVILQQICKRVGNLLRGGDTLGRFGGEEFVLLLPNTDVEQARIVAERIRTTIAVAAIDVPEVTGGIPMTISLGLATYPDDGANLQDLLAQADAAMYLSKRLGRNQVRTAAEARQSYVDQDLRTLVRQAEQREMLEREEVALAPLRDSSTLKTIYSLLVLLERRDPNMSQHAHMVSDLATALATALGLDAPQVARIGLAALVHDIGKVAIPDLLLYKGGPLAAHEQALLHDHAMLGAQILEASPFLHDLMLAVRHHHERWDGGGYPDKLVGEDIPLSARIIAVAEAYDAMQRERPYQSSRTPTEARAEMQRWSGTQFDPQVVQALWKVLAMQEGIPIIQEPNIASSQRTYSLSASGENI